MLKNSFDGEYKLVFFKYLLNSITHAYMIQGIGEKMYRRMIFLVYDPSVEVVAWIKVLAYVEAD